MAKFWGVKKAGREAAFLTEQSQRWMKGACRTGNPGCHECKQGHRRHDSRSYHRILGALFFALFRNLFSNCNRICELAPLCSWFAFFLFPPSPRLLPVTMSTESFRSHYNLRL